VVGEEGGSCSSSGKSKAPSSSGVGTMFEHAFWKNNFFEY